LSLNFLNMIFNNFLIHSADKLYRLLKTNSLTVSIKIVFMV
jgi:hypothetical protein